MRKKLFTAVLLLLLSMGIASAAQTLEDGPFTYSVEGNEVTVTGVSADISGSVAIPSTIEGKKVTKIGNNAFEGCHGMESVSIPKTVTTIGDYAFSECFGLKSAEMKTGVTYFGEGAFYLCMSLESIKISDSVQVISPYAFAGCSSLKKITLPVSMNDLYPSSFMYCTSLESFYISHLNTTFAASGGVLYTKDKTVIVAVPANIEGGVYTIPDSVEYIFPGAFTNTSIKKLTIPKTVTSISPLAFLGSNISLYFHKDSPALEYADSILDADCFIINGEKRGLYVNRGYAGPSGISFAVVNDTDKPLKDAAVYIAQYSGGRLLKTLTIPIDDLAAQDKIMCETTDIDANTEKCGVFLWDKNLRPLV